MRTFAGAKGDEMATGSRHFYLLKRDFKPFMISKESIAEVIAEYLEREGLFLVEIEVSSQNDVEISIESHNGCVTLEHCEAIDEIVHNNFDQNLEDYSLTVGSAGLDQPFKVAGQYEKYTGSQVEILFADGKKRKGLLAGFSQGVITFTWSALERVEGKKRRVPVEHTDMVDLKEIKWCKPVIDFK